MEDDDGNVVIHGSIGSLLNPSCDELANGLVGRPCGVDAGLEAVDAVIDQLASLLDEAIGVQDHGVTRPEPHRSRRGHPVTVDPKPGTVDLAVALPPSSLVTPVEQGKVPAFR